MPHPVRRPLSWFVVLSLASAPAAVSLLVLALHAARLAPCTRSSLSSLARVWALMGRPAATFPSNVGLLWHEREGVMLFDTGYAPRFAALRNFPALLYSSLIPVHVTERSSAVAQLGARGIAATDVRWIFLSHFHADHIAGLLDFPCARFVYLQEAYADLADLVASQSLWHALAHGLVPALVPADFLDRSCSVALRALQPDASLCGLATLDFFGDGSVRLVSLPGHAVGHMGLAVRDGLASDSRVRFFIGDAAWSDDAVQCCAMPHAFARCVTHDWEAYAATLQALHDIRTTKPAEVDLIPSHSQSVAARFRLIGRHRQAEAAAARLAGASQQQEESSGLGGGLEAGQTDLSEQAAQTATARLEHRIAHESRASSGASAR